MKKVKLPPLQRVTQQTFEVRVLKRGKPVLVTFTHPLCISCKKVDEDLRYLSRDFPELDVVSIEVPNNKQLAAVYKIYEVPTMLLFDGGEVTKKIKGAKHQFTIEDELGLVYEEPTGAA